MDLLLSLAFSTHLGLNGDYNEIHPHLRFEDKQYIAGMYYNSEQYVSFYAGKVYEIGTVDIELGLVTGYSAIGVISPMARITYSVDDSHQLFIAPVVEKFNNDTNIGLVLGYEFKIK